MEQRHYAIAINNENETVILGRVMEATKSVALAEFRRNDNRKTVDPRWYFSGFYYAPLVGIKTCEQNAQGQWIEVARSTFKNTAARKR